MERNIIPNNTFALQILLSKVFNTDSIIFNTIICLAIPIILQYFISIRFRFYPYIEKLMLTSFYPMATRHIIFRYRDETPHWYSTKKPNRNDILQKAVMLYISFISKEKDLKFKDADISFMALDEANESMNHPNQNNSSRKGVKRFGQSLRTIFIS